MPDLRLLRGGADKAGPEKNSTFTQTTIVSPADLVGMTGRESDKSSTELRLDAIEPGSTLGHYLIVSKIGEGGMGEVYKAHDTTLDRTVVLKVLSPHLFRNQEFLQRFRVEAQAQARLNGPNIVTLHSLFEVAGSLVLVMEYVEGQTLAQRIHNTGRLSVGTSVWVFEQALIGVERAHRMGIVHRDLKPSNIFITGAHEIKLMDFGVAKILANKELTQTGSMIGTLMYISPEQISGKDADFRSDIYALGITLFEAVTGKLPFDKKTDYEYMDAHLHAQPPQPSSIQADIPKELEAVILKAIEKDPDKRFQNALEFRSALIKVGMLHVKAYRRLKTIRKDKDRAVLSQYPSQAAQPDLSTTAASDTTLAVLRRILFAHKNYVLAAVSLTSVAGIALALGYYLAQAPAKSVAASSTLPSTMVAPPVVDMTALAPAPSYVLSNSPPGTQLSIQEAPRPVANVGNTPVNTLPHISPSVTPPIPTTVIKSPRVMRKTQPVVTTLPAEKAPVENKKYDSLRKAWGSP